MLRADKLDASAGEEAHGAHGGAESRLQSYGDGKCVRQATMRYLRCFANVDRQPWRPR